jgi:hypothetical protein
MTSALRVRQLASSLGKNALAKNTAPTQRGVRRSSSAVVVASLPKHVKGSGKLELTEIYTAFGAHIYSKIKQYSRILSQILYSF